MRIDSGKKRSTGQDCLIRLALLFRIPPAEIDDRLSAADASNVLHYLGRWPEAADVVDVQIARLIQVVQGLVGQPSELSEILIRGKVPETDETQAEDWLRYLNERKNRSTA